jgi:hypothetical protein
MNTMARDIVIKATKRLSNEEEVALLRARFNDPQTVDTGPRWRVMGDLLEVINADSSMFGQIVMVRMTGTPDNDNDYRVWYVTENGTVEETYVDAGYVKSWEPPVRKRTRKSASAVTASRKRRLDFGADA